MESYNSTLMPLPSGTVICGYRLKSVIAQGGFGITYLGERVATGEEVVVKESLPEHCVTRCAGEVKVRVLPGREGTGKGSYKKTTEAFIREARTLWSLHHPCIVGVSEAFQSDDTGTAYYVMPYLRGESLAYYIGNQTRPSKEWLLYIMAALLDALSYVHGTGRLHRDIKPGNIILESDGRPVLIDFGSSRAVDVSDKTCIYTPGYCPVEQKRGGEEGCYTDIYSLGATLYHWVSGAQVPSYEYRVGRYDRFQPLAGNQELVAKYGATVLATIDRAVGVEPEDRFASADEWRAALAAEPAFQTAVPVLPPQTGTAAVAAAAAPTFQTSQIPLEEPKKGGKRSGLLVALVLLLILLLGGVCAWKFLGEEMFMASTEEGTEAGLSAKGTAGAVVKPTVDDAQDEDSGKQLTAAELPKRVLARPGSYLYEDATSEDPISSELPLYAVYYIKGESDTRYQVSEKPDTETVGWLKKDRVYRWENNLVLQFTHPGGVLQRDPAVFFDSYEHAQSFFRSPERKRCDVLDRLKTKADASDIAPGILAKEPDLWSPDCNHSLLPVLEAKQLPAVQPSNQSEVYLRTVALSYTDKTKTGLPGGRPSGGVTTGTGGDEGGNTDEEGNGDDGNGDDEGGEGKPGDEVTITKHDKIVDVDIVFVVDTTRSMEPYIRTICNYLRGKAAEIDGLTEHRARFGFVGYRDFALEGSGVDSSLCEYVSHVYTPAKMLTAEEFSEISDDIVATKADSIDYAEDVLSGVQAGIRQIPWRENSMHIIYLIGDARGRSGSIGGGDEEDEALCNNKTTWKRRGKGSLTGMNPEQVVALTAPDGHPVYVRPMYLLAPPAHENASTPLYTEKEWRKKVKIKKNDWDKHILSGILFFERLANESLSTDDEQRKQGNITVYTLDYEYKTYPLSCEGAADLTVNVGLFDVEFEKEMETIITMTVDPTKRTTRRDSRTTPARPNGYSAAESIFSAAYLEWCGRQPLPETDEEGNAVEIEGWTYAQDPTERDIVKGCVVLSRRQVDELAIRLEYIISLLQSQEDEGVAECMDSLFNLMLITTTDPNLNPNVKMPEATLSAYMKNLPWMTPLMNIYMSTIKNGDEMSDNLTMQIVEALNSKRLYLRSLLENERGMWIKGSERDSDLIAIPLNQLP